MFKNCYSCVNTIITNLQAYILTLCLDNVNIEINSNEQVMLANNNNTIKEIKYSSVINNKFKNRLKYIYQSSTKSSKRDKISARQNN